MATQKKAFTRTEKQTAAYHRHRNGLMTKKETFPLVMTARKAFAYQQQLGNLDEAETFDTWRHAQVHEITGNDGLTKCHHDDYKPLMAHFLILAGEDASAFVELTHTGPASSDQSDTHEFRRQLAHSIVQILEAHLFIADHSVAECLAADQAKFEAAHPGHEYPGASQSFLRRLYRAKNAIEQNPAGAIRHGYLISLVRAKTRRPSLTLGKDLQADLADRLTVDQLLQIRDTLQNRISAREGSDDRGRNARQRT